MINFFLCSFNPYLTCVYYGALKKNDKGLLVNCLRLTECTANQCLIFGNVCNYSDRIDFSDQNPGGLNWFSIVH